MKYSLICISLINILCLILSIEYIQQRHLILILQDILINIDNNYGSIISNDINSIHLGFYFNCISIIITIIGIIFIYFKFKHYKYILNILLLISSSIMIYSGLIFYTFNENIKIDEYLSPNPNDISNKNLVLYHFGLSVFDECCLSNDYKQQAKALNCNETLNPYDQLLNPNIKELISMDDASKFAVCINNYDYYNNGILSIKNSNICNLAKDIKLKYEPSLSKNISII